MRQFQKNVIKNMVKQNQRLLDYKSPFGVKFWNYILRQTKERDTKKRKKVRKENIQSTIIALRDYWEREIPKLEGADKERFKIYMELTEPFMTNDWTKIIDRTPNTPNCGNPINTYVNFWVDKDGNKVKYYSFWKGKNK